MYSRIVSTIVLLGLGMLSFTNAATADWPQFQGPNRDGSSPDTTLARSWPKDGPTKLWSLSLGKGFGSPAVHNDEVFVLDRIDSERDVLRCIDLNTGEELWSYAYDAPGRTSYNGSRATPTVTEKHVFAVGLMGDFHCVDRSTHEPVWGMNLYSQFPQAKRPKWGFAQSPSLYKDMVIVAPQGKDAFVAAFKQDTGELVWSTKKLGGVGYSSPFVTKLNGINQVVMASAPSGELGGVTGISADEGRILWHYSGWRCKNPIPHPVVLPDNRLFITGGYGAGSAMIQIVRDGSSFSVRQLFKMNAAGSQIQQPLFYDGHLYLNANGNKRMDGMSCVTLDGNTLWRTSDDDELPIFGRGSLILVDDILVCLNAKSGFLYLVEPSPEGFKELARAEILDGKMMWSPMALSKGKLVLRSQEEMICIDLNAPQSE